MAPRRKCAKCDARAGVLPVTMAVGADTVVVDLCELHRKPVVTLMKLGSTTPGRQPAELTKSPGHQVIPVD